jgi:hypothetical protein
MISWLGNQYHQPSTRLNVVKRWLSLSMSLIGSKQVQTPGRMPKCIVQKRHVELAVHRMARKSGIAVLMAVCGTGKEGTWLIEHTI